MRFVKERVRYLRTDVAREIDRVLTELQVVDPIMVTRERHETGREEKKKTPL